MPTPQVGSIVLPLGGRDLLVSQRPSPKRREDGETVERATKKKSRLVQLPGLLTTLNVLWKKYSILNDDNIIK